MIALFRNWTQTDRETGAESVVKNNNTVMKLNKNIIFLFNVHVSGTRKWEMILPRRVRRVRAPARGGGFINSIPPSHKCHSFDYFYRFHRWTCFRFALSVFEKYYYRLDSNFETWNSGADEVDEIKRFIFLVSCLEILLDSWMYSRETWYFPSPK